MAQVNIYFGSQSGTAECFSEIISDEAKEKGITCEVIDLDRFTPESFVACKIAILVVATYGDGEPSDNAAKFHKWATDPRHGKVLAGQRFTVMGLGDMNYSKFNNMGQTTEIGLDVLGSKCIYKRGVGDDSQDIEADFRKWKDRGLWEALQQAVREITAEGGWPAPAEKKEEPKGGALAPLARKTRILCAGGEAKEAGEALAAAWPGGNVVVEDTSLGALANATGEKAQVIIAVECNGEGLCDEGRGFATQLGSCPMAIKQQLRALRFSVLAVASTEYGNAGERASANAVTSQITSAASSITQALQKVGAGCVATRELDLQNADEKSLGSICAEFQKGFQDGIQEPSKAALPWSTGAQLKIADSVAALPAECQGEPAEVLCKFYFEADRAKVAKVRELRQKPSPEEGLSTAEIEIEASGELKNYALGGTLSVLPESDPADVDACMALLGLKPADASKVITFLPAEGPSKAKIKRPFPTPCTIGQALSRYCDLGRAPTKKMLQAMQPKLTGQAAEHVVKLLADADALKLLHAAPLCCRMHEFWSLLGVAGLDLQEFLLHCPRQKPREFTIASSPKAAPTKITLCVSLTSHILPEGGKTLTQLQDMGCIPKDAALPAVDSRRFFGLCSRWLATRLKAGDEVLAKQRASPFHLPEKDVPVVMIGSGAGVAPFRGFWEELRRGTQQAPAALFFGCRHPDEDWLFKEEMSGSVKLTTNACAALARMQVGPKRPLTMLHTAFSRPGEGKESKYVQKAIGEQKMSVKHWVEKMSGCVFICGSSAMGNAVLEALAEALEGGKDTVEQLRKDGRIVAEMWG